jgi:hypothetical protein
MQMQTLERLEGLMDFSEGNQTSQHFFVLLRLYLLILQVFVLCTE